MNNNTIEQRPSEPVRGPHASPRAEFGVPPNSFHRSQSDHNANLENARLHAGLETLNDRINTLNQRFINTMVDTAIVQGKIRPTEREHWLAQLANNFDAKSVELTNAKPILKTEFNRAFPNRMEAPNPTAQELKSRQKQIKSLVNKKMTEESIDYTTAFLALKAENPDLFGVTADEQHRAANPPKFTPNPLNSSF